MMFVVYFSGYYIYIEASESKSNIKAKLASPWVVSTKTQCLQFWYFMYGYDTGSLKIFTKNNKSEKCVWEQKGDHGDIWRYGQTTLESQGASHYQV